MANTFALTTPLVAGTPIRNGNNVLSGNNSLSPSATTHTGLAVTSNLITAALVKFGNLTADCTVDIEISIDGGSNYRKSGISFTNAEMSTPLGIAKTFQVKATHIRAWLNVGTMTGSNGVNIRYLD